MNGLRGDIEMERQQAALWRPQALPGVEMLRARFVRQNFAPHFHRRYAVGVIEHGAMAFRYLGREHVAPAGTVNLVEPGETHTGHSAVDNGWTYRMLYFGPEQMARVLDEMDRARDMPHFASGVLEDPILAGSIRMLHLGMEEGISSLEAQTRFLAVLTRWVSHHAMDRPRISTLRISHQAVRTARDMLDEHFSEDISLTRLAGQAGVSPFHLARMFRDQIGLPPHAYQDMLRVRMARELLERGERPVDAALAVGYSDQSHLNRRFKRIVGVTPGAFRKIVQS